MSMASVSVAMDSSRRLGGRGFYFPWRVFRARRPETRGEAAEGLLERSQKRYSHSQNESEFEDATERRARAGPFLLGAAAGAGAAFRPAGAQLPERRGDPAGARGDGRRAPRATPPGRGGLGDGRPDREPEALPGEPGVPGVSRSPRAGAED